MNNGQIASSADTVTGETIAYQYDSLKRLITATSTPLPSANATPWSETYAYDGFGNLTGMSGNAAPPLSQAISVVNGQPTNQFVGVSYDGNGNVTAYGPPPSATLGYDVANRLQTVNSTNAYAYDPSNRRVYFRNSTGTETLYIFGAGGKKLAAYTIAGTTGSQVNFTFQSRNVYFAGKLISAQGNAVSRDRLGSVRWNSATGGHTYFPYGVEYYGDNNTTTNDTEKYATYTRDSLTGLDYAMNRYYSNTWGRFMTPDASGRGAHLGDPGSWNLYAYAGDDPVNNSDPSGKCQQPSGLGQGQVGVCVGTFISTPTVPGGDWGPIGAGLGNNRGPDSSGGGYKDQFEVTYDPTTGSVGVLAQVSESFVSLGGGYIGALSAQGQFTQLAINDYIDPNGNAQVSIVASAENGFASTFLAPLAPTGTINLSIWLTITPEGQVTVNPGSTYSGYPSLEIWTYQQGQPPQVLSIAEGSISSLGTWNTPIPPWVVNPNTGGGSAAGTAGSGSTAGTSDGGGGCFDIFCATMGDDGDDDS
jgi:RHS repeat-associated protein